MSVAAPLRVFQMSPSTTLDFGFNWADLLDHDTISSSSWACDAGVSIGSAAQTASVTIAFVVAGATPGSYDVTNTIVTAQGRTDSRSFRIVVVQR